MSRKRCWGYRKKSSGHQAPQINLNLPNPSSRRGAFFAYSIGVEGVIGKYFDECKETQPSPLTLDLVERKHFMDVTDKMLGL
jgi:hypothetical protein